MTPRRSALSLALFLAALASADRGHAQPTPQGGADRPRVGLVLSGGGARGFAHLGVLKVLHEMHVPVDVIAGTSMGAVVGGVYATGLSYPELEALVRSEDWARIFQDEPPRQWLPMRRKRIDRQVPMGIELGLNRGGFQLPPALVGGSKLTNALQAYTYQASGLASFDELPIPFRAIAAGLTDGEMVVLSRGNLGEAIRASMAVPGAFSPKRVEDRRLIDGGIVRNLPIDVARDSLGAQVVIVSDVSTMPEDVPEPESAIGVLTRLTIFMTSENVRAQLATLEDSDVYVRPDLRTIDPGSFTALDSAMTMGEAAARAVADRLRPLAVPAHAYDSLTTRRAAALGGISVLRPVALVVDTSETRLSPQVVRRVLGVGVGDTISPKALRDDLSRVVGYGGFESVEFRVDMDAEGETLEVRPRDKSWGPFFLRPALSLTDQQRGAGAWSLRAYLEWTRMTARGGELWGEVEVGTRHGLRLWTHLPFDPGDRAFAVGFASLGRSEVVPEVAGIPVGLDLTDRQGFAGLGIRIGWWGDLIVGGWIASNKLAAPPDLEGTEDEVWSERSLEARLDIDVLDRVVYPSSGFRARATYTRADSVAGGDVAFDQLLLDVLGAASAGPLTGTLSVLASSGLGTEVPYYRAQSIGGIERLTVLERDAIWGGYAVVGKATVSYRFGANAADAGGGLRLGLSGEAGQAQPTSDGWAWLPSDLLWGGSVWLGLGTLAGPVTLAYGKVQGRPPGWVLQFGAPR